jgi:Zn-dependent peptidase ImmA (M78 family)
MNDLMAKIPWLSYQEIAQASSSLLCGYAAFTGRPLSPPIPVEAIIEKYLGLVLEYEDLVELLGIPDVLGATWVEDKRIVIHEPLLEGVEGRLTFTCAHEVGHWILHREWAIRALQRTGNRAIVCRDGSAKLRGEWQADYFAACLLMPEAQVRKAFESVFGDEPLVMHNVRGCFGRWAIVLDPALDTAPEIAEAVKVAGGFTNCSREAMRYRLQDLGLLVDMTKG